MLRKLQKLLELCIAATAGIYLGKVLWMWMDYRNHPALYVQDSISFSGKMSVISGIAFAVAAVEAIFYLYIRYLRKKKRELGLQKTMKTKHLTIRPLKGNDRADMEEILTNDDVRKTYLIPDFASEEEVTALFETLHKNSLSKEHYLYGICQGKRLIGFVNDVEQKGDVIELGYVIHPAYQGKGYATEMLNAVLLDLKELGYIKVLAGAFEENIASIRVMEKCGMEKTDREEDIAYRGRKHHCVYYEKVMF